MNLGDVVDDELGAAVVFGKCDVPIRVCGLGFNVRGCGVLKVG